MPKKKSSAKKKGNKPKKSACQLVNIADDAMQSLDVQTALINYQQAVPLLENQDTDDCELLSTVLAKLAECKVSIGDQDGARDDFERAIQLSPPGPVRACLYHYVGQLSSDEEALDAHLKGIEELEQCIIVQNEQNDDNGVMNGVAQSDIGNTDSSGTATTTTTLADLKLHLVRAHCAVAELYLTDLCFEENAEQTCESHVQKALQLRDPPLVDALQAMASLRLSQQKDATPFIMQVYQEMKIGCEALAALVGLKEDPIHNDDDRMETPEEPLQAIELTEVDAANSLPGFEFRCQTAKLLLECAAAAAPSAETTNSTTDAVDCVQAAIHVLGSLLAENDEIIEIWFLLGCAFDLLPSCSTLAQQYWQQALDMLLKVEEQLKQGSHDDDDDDIMLQQLNECQGQIQDIQNKLERLQQNGNQDDDDDDEDMEVE